MQGAAERLFSEFRCNFDPYVVGLSPGRQVVVVLSRHCQIAALDRDVAMQSGQRLVILQAIAPILPQFFQEKLLRIIMLGESAGRAGNLHKLMIHSLSRSVFCTILPDLRRNWCYRTGARCVEALALLHILMPGPRP